MTVSVDVSSHRGSGSVLERRSIGKLNLENVDCEIRHLDCIFGNLFHLPLGKKSDWLKMSWLFLLIPTIKKQKIGTW